MRLPLLLGARPPYCKAGAQVPLVSGEWEVEVVGLKDTLLYLWSNRAPTHTRLGIKPVKIDGSRNVRVYIEKAGSEEHISAFVRRIA